MRLTVLVVGLAVLAPSLHAQGAGPTYVRSAADTLRYHEVSRGTVELTTPQGVVPVQTHHDARMAVTFGAADTARAWYEALTIGVTSPQGEQRPETGEALGQPFVLRFDSRGRIETLATPSFPASFEGVTDLTQQFADYFLPLPGAPLRAGTTWVDSVTRVDAKVAGRRSEFMKRGSYRVTGDTVIAGRQALVIASVVQQRMSSEQTGDGRTIVSELAGREDGQFFWDVAGGRLLGRARSADLAGTLRMGAGSASPSFPQRMRYTNRLELVQ